jgi:hypothetical protein
MARDVDLMRQLLLQLEKEQRSPPEAIFAPVEQYARLLDASNREVMAALDLLADLDFIEGPGAWRDDAWLFRKLTRRGVQLAAAVRDTREWGKVKDVYGALLDG